MAGSSGLSHTSVQRIWRAFGLQPHRSEHFKLSTDPQLIEKVRDIVGLYLNPPTAPWCSASMRRPDPGPRSHSADAAKKKKKKKKKPGAGSGRAPDRRLPAAWHHSLFAALDVATGKVIGQIHRRHRAVEFRSFLDRIDMRCPKKKKKKKKGLRPPPGAGQPEHPQDGVDPALAAPAPALPPPLHPHLLVVDHQVERWFAELTRKQLRRGGTAAPAATEGQPTPPSLLCDRHRGVLQSPDIRGTAPPTRRSLRPMTPTWRTSLGKSAGNREPPGECVDVPGVHRVPRHV